MFPGELLTLVTIGVIYDETDGMSLLPDFGMLEEPAFTWAGQGELLLRKRKPWYFKRPPYPKVTPTSDYLVELLSS